MIWLLVIFLVAELFYFKLADKFSIVDKPNKRSSHNYITRRGGGIIFPLAWILFSVYNDFIFPWFTLGLILISVISFLDDIKEVAVIPRLLFHLLSISLMIYDFGMFNMLPIWMIVICFILSMAILNAINFMDGINGITGLYALCFWVSIALFSNVTIFEDPWNLTSPIPFIISSLIIFGFFNFRNYAVCFAGDVGSVSMAFMIVGMLLFMIFHPVNTLFSDLTSIKSESFNFGFEPKYLLLLSVYGIDSFLTILHRLVLRENIFKGHRTHLYQYLVNELKLPHLAIASGYAFIQLGINAYVLNSDISLTESITIILLLSIVYTGLKYYITKHVVNFNHEKIDEGLSSRFTTTKNQTDK